MNQLKSLTAERYRLDLCYHGKAFSGFQVQPEKITIQQLVEETLERILNEKIKIVSSGRTDAGVHALNQVAHFDIFSDKAKVRIKKPEILYNLNSLLPAGIKIIKIKKVSTRFHARANALKKIYQYHLLCAAANNPFLQDYVWCIYKKLDLKAMQKAAHFLEGKFDFSAFCASDSNAKDKIREIECIKITKKNIAPFFNLPQDQLIVIEFTGKGFLKQMVRNIVGTLVAVGLGKIEATVVKEILKSKNRQKAFVTAPPQGLFLKKVFYGVLPFD